MRLRTSLAAVMLVAILGACNSTTSTPTPGPNAAFCDSLTNVAIALADYQRLGPDDSIEAYKAGAQAVADAVDAASEAGKGLTEAKVDLLASSAAGLRSYLQDLPQDVPVAQVQTSIQAQIRAVALQRQTLGVMVCAEPAAPTVAAESSPAAS